MSDFLALPEPKKNTSRRSRKFASALIVLFMGLLVVGWKTIAPQMEVVATIPLDSSKRVESSIQNELIEQWNHSLVRVMVDQRDFEMVPLTNLGIRFSEVPPSLFFRSSVAQAEYGPSLQATVDYRIWKDHLNTLKNRVERPTVKPAITWSETSGWTKSEGQSGVRLNSFSEEKVLSSFVDAVRNDIPASFLLSTTIQEPLTSEEALALEIRYEKLQSLLKPIQLRLENNLYELDLNTAKEFIDVTEHSVEVNREMVREWVEAFVSAHSRTSSKVKIVGSEELRPGVHRAVTEGEFKEGLRLNPEEITGQILSALEKGDTEITVKSYEIPVKVYSELEQSDYELLSVGYSEYSTGNAPNRVHNVTTGINRINGLLYDPGQEISFNKSVGTIDYDFRVGYGIFGSEALPVLGGGICQVSTTFYRALLNLGVPITMRQNHSWDLSYYQTGGYGLDATIFPEKGLDVKAVNDVPSQLFLYSYVRPETEEAFVLIYGKKDGRKVTLKPEKDYVPFKGGKTIKWKQTVEMPDGQIRETEIVSRYRA